jgi:DNA replication factor GINS
MYDKLFSAWQYENENEGLSILESNFYSKISEYIKTLREKTSKKSINSLNSSLLLHELNHVLCMVEELISIRYKKLVNINNNKTEINLENLPLEEKNLFSNFLYFRKEFQNFKNKTIQGNIVNKEMIKRKKRVTLRILENIPALIGVDMNSYGPFFAEDVASLPLENANLLIKQGLGKLVETE